jgi:transcription initiation factor TFIIB
LLLKYGSQKAAYIYRKGKRKGMVRGRTISAMLAAATYIACREIGVRKTLKDIAQGTNVKTLMLGPMRCIAKVANKMQVNERITRQGMNIMQTAIRKEASAGKNAMGLAAAVLYILYLNNNINNSVYNKSNESNNNKASQTSFAQAAGITDVTLRNSVKGLKNQLLLLN